jgi:hypothetical protein
MEANGWLKCSQEHTTGLYPETDKFSPNPAISVPYDQFQYLIKPRFWTLSIVTGYKKNTTFRELHLLPSSGKGGGPTQLGPLQRTSLSHWTSEL